MMELLDFTGIDGIVAIINGDFISPHATTYLRAALLRYLGMVLLSIAWFNYDSN
jgi:hypothetical protein